MTSKPTHDELERKISSLKKEQLKIIKELEDLIISDNPQKILECATTLNNMLPSFCKLHFNANAAKQSNAIFCPNCGKHIENQGRVKKYEPYFAAGAMPKQRSYVNCSCGKIVDTEFREYYPHPPEITEHTSVNDGDLWWQYMKNLLPLLADRLVLFHEFDDKLLARMSESAWSIEHKNG